MGSIGVPIHPGVMLKKGRLTSHCGGSWQISHRARKPLSIGQVVLTHVTHPCPRPGMATSTATSAPETLSVQPATATPTLEAAAGGSGRNRESSSYLTIRGSPARPEIRIKHAGETLIREHLGHRKNDRRLIFCHERLIAVASCPSGLMFDTTSPV